MARSVLNTRVANLDYLCRRFSIDLSDRKLHGALLDSQLLAEVYLELRGGKQIDMNLKNTEAKKSSKDNETKMSKHVFLKIKPTKNEILQHKTNIKPIKDSLWEKIDY